MWVIVVISLMSNGTVRLEDTRTMDNMEHCLEVKDNALQALPAPTKDKRYYVGCRPLEDAQGKPFEAKYQ